MSRSFLTHRETARLTRKWPQPVDGCVQKRPITEITADSREPKKNRPMTELEDNGNSQYPRVQCSRRSLLGHRFAFSFVLIWHIILGTICVLSAFPFIFLGCLGCGSSDEWAQVIYYTPFVIIFQFGWAATQISHLALIPSITQDPHDRTDLVAIRYGFTVMANITVYLVTWLVLGIDATSAETGLGPEDGIKFRYIVMAVLAIGIIFVSVFHALVKEDNVPQYSRILPDTEVTCEDESNHTNHLSSSQQNSVSHCAPVHCRMTAIDWLQNMQFYQIAMLYMGTRLFCNLSQAYVPIYIQDSLQLPQDSVAYIPQVMYVSGFLTSTIMKALNKYIGRKVSTVC
nr:major facilitator superfamily domain-containing protein 12-like [Cherax quadricarinatus]